MRRFAPSPITSLVDQSPRYNLGESYGRELVVADVLRDGGMATLADVALGYATSVGGPELRQLLAADLGVDASEVLITAGAVSALFLLGLVVADGDTEVVVAQPCFPPLRAALDGIGAHVVTAQLRFEEGYRLDATDVGRRLSPRTSLVALASPQNPSGVVIRREEIDRLLDAMASVCPAAILLVDETFREAVYGDTAVPASVAPVSLRVVTCGSLSKAHGAPGLRVGWMTVRDPDLYEQLRLAKFNTAISCGSVDEFLATRLLRRADTILEPRRARLAEALDVVAQWVDAHRAETRWVRPDAGAFCCIQLKPDRFDGPDVEHFHSRLADGGILVARGEWFGDSANVFRVGFAYEPIEKLRDALEIMGEALRRRRSRSRDGGFAAPEEATA